MICIKFQRINLMVKRVIIEELKNMQKLAQKNLKEFSKKMAKKFLVSYWLLHQIITPAQPNRTFQLLFLDLLSGTYNCQRTVSEKNKINIIKNRYTMPWTDLYASLVPTRCAELYSPLFPTDELLAGSWKNPNENNVPWQHGTIQFVNRLFQSLKSFNLSQKILENNNIFYVVIFIRILTIIVIIQPFTSFDTAICMAI